MQANQEILKLQANAAEEAERSAAAVQAQQSLQDEVQAQQQVQELLHIPPLPPLCQKCGVHLKDLILCRHCHGDGRMLLSAHATLLRCHHCLLRHLTFPLKPF